MKLKVPKRKSIKRLRKEDDVFIGNIDGNKIGKYIIQTEFYGEYYTFLWWNENMHKFIDCEEMKLDNEHWNKLFLLLFDPVRMGYLSRDIVNGKSTFSFKGYKVVRI